MGERANAVHTPPAVSRSICSLVVAHDGVLALVVGGRERWHNANGYTFIPAELPAGDLDGETVAGDALAQTVAAIGRRWLSCEATLLPNDATYGPSDRHAIDRLAVSVDDALTPLPLLHLERLAPLDEIEGERSAHGYGDGAPLSRVAVWAYRAALAAEPRTSAETAGILWLAPQALRLALLGVPLADLLARPGVGWQPGPHAPLPDDAFIFVPSDHGERHLLRIAAKYGPSKLGLTVTIRDESRSTDSAY